MSEAPAVDELAAEMSGRVKAPAGGPVRIRDAATLVVIDDSGSEPRILVGQRSSRHVFMAGKLVFPGGRVDRTDLALAGQFEMSEPALLRLSAGTGARFTPRRAIALGLAAIRETFEETGIMIGRRASFEARTPFWRDFAEAGILPDPGALRPFARAITPPGRVRRFDTRFFAVRADAIAASVPFDQRPTEELDAVRWVSLEEMLAGDLAAITRRVLADLTARLEAGTLEDAATSMPFYRQLNGRAQRTLV